MTSRLIKLTGICIAVTLASCGQIQSDSAYTQVAGDPSELAIESPEVQLQKTMVVENVKRNLTEKAGIAKGYATFADELDADEFVTQVQICASEFIESLQLTTNKRILPKRGGAGGSCYSVALNPSESIMRVTGTTNDQGINSLAFTTNQGRNLGPWGNSATGAAFDMNVYGGPNGKFNGWRGIVGDAQGVQVVSQLTLLQQGMGGAGGNPWIDRLQDDEWLKSIKTCWRANGFVTSVQLTTNVASRIAHGGWAPDLKCETATMADGEYPVEIFGRADTYVNAVGYKTNLGRRLGPFGGSGGYGFNQSIGDAQRFYGMYGRSGGWMDSIGLIEPMVNPDSNYRGFQDNVPAGKTVNAVEVCSGTAYGTEALRSIQTFIDGNVGLSRHGARANEPGLNCSRINLNPNEVITRMSGTSTGVITSLKFTTNQGRQFVPFAGSPSGREFSIKNPWPSFLGFAGNASQAGNPDRGTIYNLDFSTPATFGEVDAPSASAKQNGWWDKPATWPIVGIHAAVLTDGRVMTYGTDIGAAQGAQFTYDIWDPKQGFGANSHLTLPNNLGVDMFCSGQSLLANGRVILAGGDLRDAGYNRGTKNTTFLNPTTNQLESGSPMSQARWYNSQKVMANGQVITLGGYDANAAASTTPEVFNGSNWVALTGAANANAFNGNYIRAFATRSTMKDGVSLWIISTNGDGNYNGKIYRLEVTGNNGTGMLIDYGIRLPGYYSWDRPVAQIASDKVLFQLNDGSTVIVNLPNDGGINSIPSIESAGTLSQPRPWSEMVVLPTGEVLAINGSRASNQLVDVAYHGEIWNPSTKTWRKVASQLRPRLYHSTAVLLADGKVMTIGSGSPAPTLEMNAQAFLPPYFFKSNGSPHVRPTANPASYMRYGSTQTFSTSGGAVRATLVRLSATSHSFNSEQQFRELTVLRTGASMRVVIPAASTALPPGAYYLTVINSAGVPSESKIVTIGN
jgi:hypothetical protein